MDNKENSINSKINSLIGFIWSVADDCLRDVYVRGKYRDIILPMTVIKRLDSVLEPKKKQALDFIEENSFIKDLEDKHSHISRAIGESFCNISKFNLLDLTSSTNKQTLKENFINYLDGFSDRETPEKFKEDPYRFLIVADKYQTGYDEPLLHTMYVDKILNDVKAVQTLSRLNRCMFGKVDTCVLDFANKSEEIMKSFSRFYKQTILEGETDPNKLYDILSEIENCQVYTNTLVDECVKVFLENGDRALIDSMLDSCVENYKDLDEENQVIFKSGAKAFVRTYNFLASILPISQPQWEKISIFLTLLIPKLPAPKEEDLSKGILESIDLESYRAHKNEEMSISLSDEHSIVNSMGASIGNKQEVQIEFLDVIVNNLNDIWGNIQWNDKESVAKQINNLPDIIMKNESFRNTMENSDEQNSRIEFENALDDVMKDMFRDNLELFNQFNTNKSFRKYIADMIFEKIYNKHF